MASLSSLANALKSGSDSLSSGGSFSSGNLADAFKEKVNNSGYSTLEDHHNINEPDVKGETENLLNRIDPNNPSSSGEITKISSEKFASDSSSDSLKEAFQNKYKESSSEGLNKLDSNEQINSIKNEAIKKLEANEQSNNFSEESLNKAEINEQIKNSKFDEKIDKLEKQELENYLKNHTGSNVVSEEIKGISNGSVSSSIIGGGYTPAPGGDIINVSMSEIPNIISKLRSCETKVREIWGELLNNYIAQIENSWAGADASAYVEKIRSYETKVNNSAQALSLLADTYQKVLTSSQETQQKVTSVVNNF